LLNLAQLRSKRQNEEFPAKTQNILTTEFTKFDDDKEATEEKVMSKPILCSQIVLWLAFAASGQTPTPSPTPSPSPSECTDIRTRLTQAETKLKDWPALSRYHDDNAKVVEPAKNEQRVVFMGDSITDSWDNPSNGGFFPGKPYINRGISGQTTPQMLIRFRRDVIALKPKVVLILAGTNDIAGNTGPTTLEAIEDNLTAMAELAKLHKIRVVFASLLPISDYEVRNGQPIIQSVKRPPDKIKALNGWMKSYADANGLVYLDYFSAMVDDKGFLKDELSNDGLHPNPAGYAVMNPLAEAAIAASLKGK
jgi:lysophospholipase L1-like esterase